MRPHRAEWNPVLRKIEAIVVTLNILIVLSKTCNQVSALALPPKASSHSRQQRQHQLHASAVSACVLGSSSCACSYSAQTSGDSALCSPGGGGLVVASGALIGVSPKERNLKSARNGAAGRSVILAMSDRSSSRMHVLGKVRGGGGGSVVRSSSSSTEVSASDTTDMDCEPAGQGPGQKGFVGTLLGVSEHDP